MERPGPVAPQRTLLPQAPKVKGYAHGVGAALHLLHGGGGGGGQWTHQPPPGAHLKRQIPVVGLLPHGGGGGGGGGPWTHQPPPAEHLKRLDPVGKLPHEATVPLADRLGQAASQAQAGTAFLQEKATLASSTGGAGLPQRHLLPFSIEKNHGLGLPVPPQAQGSSGYGSSPHLHRGPQQNPGFHGGAVSGTTGLEGAAAGEKPSKPPGGQVPVLPAGQGLGPATPLGQEEQNYGLSFANSHSSSSGYYGVAFEHGQRSHNYEAAAAAAASDKEAFKARLAAGEGLLGLLTPGGPGAVGPEAGAPVSRDPVGGRPLGAEPAAVRTDQGLVAGAGQVASSLSHGDPLLTTGSTRLAPPPGLKEKRKQGPYMGKVFARPLAALLGLVGGFKVCV